MAKDTRPAAPDWDEPYGPAVADAPAERTLPPRAARLPSQNGPAMRRCFAYLLDEDPAPIAPRPPAAKERK